MKNIIGFDVLKVLLAFVIVSLHASLGGPFLSAPYCEWIRNFQNMAVPGFFVISSYVFFVKLFELSKEDQRKSLFRYEKRVLILYLSWSVIMLPITMRYHDYLSYNWMGIVYYIKDFFFGFTFMASWFFGALLVGIPIVFMLRNRPIVLLLISIFLYFYLVYIGRFPDILQLPYRWYEANVAHPNLSFPRGVVWLGIGCVLAKTRIMDRITMSPVYMYAGGILLIISILYPKLFTLIGVTVMVAVFYKASFSVFVCENAKHLRKISTIVYCVHFPVIHAVWKVIPEEFSFVVFLLASLFSIVVSEVIICLSRQKRLSFLKYLM